jgi:hypothetical protein
MSLNEDLIGYLDEQFVRVRAKLDHTLSEAWKPSRGRTKMTRSLLLKTGLTVR